MDDLKHLEVLERVKQLDCEAADQVMIKSLEKQTTQREEVGWRRG